MKYHVVFLSAVVCALFAGCGAPPPPEPEMPGPEPLAAPNVDPRSSAELQQNKPEEATVGPIRVDSTEANKKCNISDMEDGTNMVTSNEHDWFLYAPKTATVECGKFGGNALITDGPMTFTIKPLVPQGMSGKEAEKMLRDQAVGFVRSGLQEEYGSGRDLKFEEAKLGKFKRPALCADADLSMKGTPGRVVACITSKTNVNDEVVVHRTVWVGPTADYDAKATPKMVKEAAANWFLYSDTDGMGKILRKW